MKAGKCCQQISHKHYTVPDSDSNVLATACYDCHSNNTRYPFYVHIQPVAWLMSKHIKNGKADLNFSEFGTYSVRKQQSKLKAIINSIQNDEMPLSSYKLMHKDANLTQDEKALIVDGQQKQMTVFLPKIEKRMKKIKQI